MSAFELFGHCLAPARTLASPSYGEGRWGAPDSVRGFLEGLKHPEVIGYFPWWRAGDISSETHNDEARKIFDREHLRAGKTPRNAQTRDCSRDRPEYAESRTASAHSGSAGW